MVTNEAGREAAAAAIAKEASNATARTTNE